MTNTSDLLITEEATVKEAFEQLNVNAKRILLLVDANGKFSRTITDGDLRRLLLKHEHVSTKLSALPEMESIFVRAKTPQRETVSIMKAGGVDVVPVLDDDNQVVDIVTLEELEKPILLSIPHMGEHEKQYVSEAFDSNWVAPLGPNVTGFENELAEKTQTGYAAALSSGTAAIHLALVILDIKPGDRIFCPSLTFVASVNPVLYQHACPVLLDSAPGSWNICPVLLEAELDRAKRQNQLPKAVVVVNLYGHSADFERLAPICEHYGVPIVEDAAESLGASYKRRMSGTFGLMAAFSFNGNKIITTSGGGMLVSANEDYVAKARWLSTQAKDDAPYYLHSAVGYNYRMSNVLAGIGRGQLRVLDERVRQRRAIYQRYETELDDTGCFEWIKTPADTYPTHWLSVGLIRKGVDYSAQSLIDDLNSHGIEARRVWNPLHRHPLFADFEYIPQPTGSVSDDLFERGICLPSSSNMTDAQQSKVIETIWDLCRPKTKR